jgi:hypothetical protein
MKEPRVYKTSPALIVIVVLMFAILFGGIGVALGAEAIAFAAPYALIGIIILAGIFASQISKVTLSDDEITVQNLLRAKTLRWTEAARVSGRGYTIKLHNQDEDVTLAVGSQLPGYEEIVEFIGIKRPDLFSPNEYGDMKRGLGVFVMVFLVVAVILGVSVVFVYSTMDSPDASAITYLPLLVFVLIAFVFGGMVLSVPRSLTLEGNAMNLKYLFSERSLRADEISHIQLSYTQSRNGKHYFIALRLANRRNIRLSGLGISLPIAYLVLKNWHRSHTQGQFADQRPPSEDIAPNWSDRSGR